MDSLSKIQMIDGAQLQAFLAFAQERNFTRASKRVALSQPAFFERIRRLSEQLGSPLYQRVGRELH